MNYRQPSIVKLSDDASVIGTLTIKDISPNTSAANAPIFPIVGLFTAIIALSCLIYKKK